MPRVCLSEVYALEHGAFVGRIGSAEQQSSDATMLDAPCNPARVSIVDNIGQMDRLDIALYAHYFRYAPHAQTFYKNLIRPWDEPHVGVRLASAGPAINASLRVGTAVRESSLCGAPCLVLESLALVHAPQTPHSCDT